MGKPAARDRRQSPTPFQPASPPVAQPPTACLPQTGYLRQWQVLSVVPVSKSTLWRRVRSRTFPAPVKLSVRVTAWRAEDVRRWIAEIGAR